RESVKMLVQDKKDVKAARARLDGYLKDHPDEADLKTLDEAIKRGEKHAEAVKTVKAGAPAPDIKTKTVDGADFTLEALKGKIVARSLPSEDELERAVRAALDGKPYKPKEAAKPTEAPESGE